MAYSDEQWRDVRILFESGISLSEIVNREGIKIKSKGSISKRSNAEGWKVNDRKLFVSEEVQVKQRLCEILEKKESKYSVNPYCYLQRIVAKFLRSG